MTDAIVSLAKKLIVIRSVEGSAAALREALKVVLAELDGFTIERFERNGIQSALVYAASKRPKKFRVLLNIHLDSIPAKDEQYTPRVVGNRLYGAGAMDMKGNAAAVIAAFKRVAHTVSYPVALQIVTDEEIGGFDGAGYQVEKGVRADFVLAAEPTNFDIVHAAKGVLWMKVTVQGKTAHGAYPWRGENAIAKMNAFVQTLTKKYANYAAERWATTVNIARIETPNTAFNKIPDVCALWLDVRFVPQDAVHIEKTIRALASAGSKIEILAKEPAIGTDPKHPDVQVLKKVMRKILKKDHALRGAHGTSDARHFAKSGAACIEMGPIGKGIGSDDEWVDIPSLARFRAILEEFLRSLAT